MLILLLILAIANFMVAMEPSIKTSTFFLSAVNAKNKDVAQAIYTALPETQKTGSAKKFETTFGSKPSEVSGGAAPAATKEVADAIKKAESTKSANDYVEALKVIVDHTGKAVTTGLKNKGGNTGEINKIVESMRV